MAVIQRRIDCRNQKALKIIRGTLLTAADVDYLVTTTSMKVGTYTRAAQLGCPCLITVSATASGTADTMGTITITGTDAFDVAQSETIIPVAGSTVSGTKFFKTVNTDGIVGAGWVIDAGAGNDSITIGVLMSSGIYTKGYSLSVFIITGNVWVNPLITAVEGTTAIPLIAGDSMENISCDTFSLIADSSGGTYYAIIWDN